MIYKCPKCGREIRIEKDERYDDAEWIPLYI